MPAKITSLNVDDIVKEYLSGSSGKDLGRKYGVSTATITSRLKAQGVAIRQFKNRLIDIDVLVCEYLSGSSLLALSLKYGVNEKTIRNKIPSNVIRGGNGVMPVVDMAAVTELYNSGIGLGGIYKKLGSGSRPYLLKLFKEAGIPARNRSEQQFSRMANTTPEQRLQLSKAAHDAMRGTKRPFDELVKRANSRCKIVSGYELQLMDMLTERGIVTDPQFPIGPYNCDLASGSVAVEVFGGQWHWHGRHLAMTEKRVRYILNAGWNLLIVPVNAYRCKLTPAVADYVAAYINGSNSDPSGRREYRVVWRSGECFTTGGLDSDHISIVPPFRNSQNLSGG